MLETASQMSDVAFGLVIVFNSYLMFLDVLFILKGKGEMVTWWLLGKDKDNLNNEKIPEEEYVPHTYIMEDTSSLEKNPELENKETKQINTKREIETIESLIDDKIFTPVEMPGTKTH